MKQLRKLRRLGSIAIANATAAKLDLCWRQQQRDSVAHSLPGSLAVTLTSYPPRFRTLSSTLRSLLAQSIKPDHVYLWISSTDVTSLPDEVRDLEAYGLEIRICKDVRSFTKIVPALEATNGESFLVTADDDQFYRRHWLRELVGSYRVGQKEVVCARAHKIKLNAQQLPISYNDWDLEVRAGESDRHLFPTGVGGVLYEPGIFHSDVTRSEIFMNLCPTADDVWLYWMAALNGARFRKIGPRRRQIIWGGSQDVSLFSVNRTANDEQINAMISRYGFPA